MHSASEGSCHDIVFHGNVLLIVVVMGNLGAISFMFMFRHSLYRSTIVEETVLEASSSFLGSICTSSALPPDPADMRIGDASIGRSDPRNGLSAPRPPLGVESRLLPPNPPDPSLSNKKEERNGVATPALEPFEADKGALPDAPR